MSELKAAVVGRPISHSLSPRVFAAFSAAMKRPMDYRALNLAPNRLKLALKEAKRDGSIGWNVTLPHKVAALELMDRLDNSARAAGAINVAHFQKGRAIGYNTDVEGFLAPLKTRKFRISGKRAVVFGAGGAARAVCAALRRAAAGEIFIINRTRRRSRELAAKFGAGALNWDAGSIRGALAAADLVVNATVLGMGGRGNPLPPGARLKSDALAYDLVYRPRMTPFLRAAQSERAKTIGGLEMLIAVAAATWRIWFGENLPRELLHRVEEALQ